MTTLHDQHGTQPLCLPCKVQCRRQEHSGGRLSHRPRLSGKRITKAPVKQEIFRIWSLSRSCPKPKSSKTKNTFKDEGHTEPQGTFAAASRAAKVGLDGSQGEEGHNILRNWTD